MKRLFFLLLLLFCQVSVHAGDSRYWIDTSYHHEETQTRSIEAAQSLEFKPYQGDLRLGFAKGETWIRLQIQADASEAPLVATRPLVPLVLRVGPYYLDDVAFYAQQNGRWAVQQGGDRYPKQRQNCPDDLYCFSLDVLASNTMTAYLRIQTDGVRVVQTTVMPAQEVMTSRHYPNQSHDGVFDLGHRVTGFVAGVSFS